MMGWSSISRTGLIIILNFAWPPLPACLTHRNHVWKVKYGTKMANADLMQDLLRFRLGSKARFCRMGKCPYSPENNARCDDRGESLLIVL